MLRRWFVYICMYVPSTRAVSRSNLVKCMHRFRDCQLSRSRCWEDCERNLPRWERRWNHFSWGDERSGWCYFSGTSCGTYCNGSGTIDIDPAEHSISERKPLAHEPQSVGKTYGTSNV